MHEIDPEDEKELQDLADYLVEWYRKSLVDANINTQQSKHSDHEID